MEASAELFPLERLAEAEGVQAIVRLRPGSPDRPLVAFFPGGGHLARIGYGHPGCRDADFLLPQLEARGFGTIALSYPSSHPAFRLPEPELGVERWAGAAASMIAVAYAAAPAAGILGLGWSLGGRVSMKLETALAAHGLELLGFVGLSAVPPVPGFGSLRPDQFALAASGLWDSSGPASPVAASRAAHLAACDALNGRTVIPPDIYRRDYLCDTPLNFRGEPERARGGRIEYDIAEAVADQGSFGFAAYPLLAGIAASGQLDARHDLCLGSVWAWLNAQSLYFRHVAPRVAERPIAPDRWTALEALFDGLGARLSRRVAGSHVFFVGETGASATAAHVQTLCAELQAVRHEIRNLTA